MRAALLALAVLAATITPSTGAFSEAGPKHAAVARVDVSAPAGAWSKPGEGPSAARTRFGRSIGSPTEGQLVGGMHLAETPYLRIVPADVAGDVRWGLEPLVTMLDRTARALRRRFPDAVVSVGHLSREGGGELDQHRSHESGRDADVGFFVRSAGGRELLPTHFVPFRPDGSAVGWPGAYFDDAKNWALVAAMVSDPQAHVTHVFVAAPLRARLLAYAEHLGVAATLRMHAAELMQQPRGALPHDDHFHVRIGCPSHMSGCVENPVARKPAGPSLFARGRRGGPTHGDTTLVGTNPGVTNHAPARRPASPAQSSEPTIDDEATTPADPAIPPALLSAPIDDVDG